MASFLWGLTSIRPCMDLRLWLFREGGGVPLVNQVGVLSSSQFL
ncbi:hypothetical protein RJ640_002648, partial [Escallonia rubra]